MQNTVLGVLAHVDAGKTTLSEQILYETGALRTLGRVDSRTSLLDHEEIERRRGITVFSDEAHFTIGERSFSLIDTPGHVDFSGEMERSLRVLDCGILVLSSVEGIEAHTMTLWRLLKNLQIPVFLFLNKTDRAGADVPGVLKKLRELFGGGFFLFDGQFSPEEGFSQEACEFLAEQDEALLERYLEGDCSMDTMLRAARAEVKARKLFPVFSGSALKGEGVRELLCALSCFAPSFCGDREAPFSARVYRVRHDKGGKIVFLRVESGVLHPRDQIGLPNGEFEKCNELRRFQGGKYQLCKEAGPGELCAVTGVQSALLGDRVGEEAQSGVPFTLEPLLSAKAIFDPKLSPQQVFAYFQELTQEEPLLCARWQKETGEIYLRVMGKIQLEVLSEVFSERFGIQIAFGKSSVIYRETLASPVIGCGHFEPLRHYAEVHLKLSPGKRGSGIRFESACSLDELASSWQNLVKTHVLEKAHKGVLTGADLTDVVVTLLSGRSHLKHTEGGDFREATYRAIRQGLMNGESILLEPYYRYEIQVGAEELSRVQGDLLKMEAIQEKISWVSENRHTLEGKAPVRCMMDYPAEFAAVTRGKGNLFLEFAGYEPCKEAERIIAEKGYDPERDLENTPDSVFCSHGAGFPVKWNEAYSHMHLPVEKL